MKRRKKSGKKASKVVTAVAICGAVAIGGFALYAVSNTLGTPKGGYTTKVPNVTDIMDKAVSELPYEGQWVKHPSFPAGFYMPTLTETYQDENSIGTEQKDSKGELESVVGVTTLPLGSEVTDDYRTKIKSNLTPYEKFSFIEGQVKQDLMSYWDCDDVYIVPEIYDYKVGDIPALFIIGDADLIRTEERKHMLTPFTCVVIFCDDNPIAVYGNNRYPFEGDYEELQKLAKTISQTYTDTSKEPRTSYNIPTWKEPEYSDPISNREEWLNKNSKEQAMPNSEEKPKPELNRSEGSSEEE